MLARENISSIISRSLLLREERGTDSTKRAAIEPWGNKMLNLFMMKISNNGC